MSANGMCRHNNISGYCPSCVREKTMQGNYGTMAGFGDDGTASDGSTSDGSSSDTSTPAPAPVAYGPAPAPAGYVPPPAAAQPPPASTSDFFSSVLAQTGQKLEQTLPQAIAAQITGAVGPKTTTQKAVAAVQANPMTTALIVAGVGVAAYFIFKKMR
jgi:hypothetical protein